MSFGKFYSLYPNWVFDALKYAEKHNVLVISSSGNYRQDLNKFNDYFPNDNINNGSEVSDNFIKVAASTYHSNENMFASFTNYGNIDVDIFAPGIGIYTTSASKDKYISNEQGSSYSSALTSGVAALLYSYYPNLTASQIKHIIMDSGVEYTFPVKVPIKDSKKDSLIEFNQLSKSGKIVNAYNALIMADSISKNN
jgi:subtilisin family serine protease